MRPLGYARRSNCCRLRNMREVGAFRGGLFGSGERLNQARVIVLNVPDARSQQVIPADG
jgi:hypothetical protein